MIVEAKYIEVANCWRKQPNALKRIINRYGIETLAFLYCTKVKFEGACFLMLTAGTAADRNQSRMVFANWVASRMSYCAAKRKFMALWI
jgi:hypothetical protein